MSLSTAQTTSETAFSTRNLLILLLTGVGASVDVTSYVRLGHVFTANMTGNTVLLGIALGQLEPQAIMRSSLALTGYVLGAAVGALIVRRVRGAAWSHTVTAALALEALVLGIASAVWLWLQGPMENSALQSTLIVAMALVMGVQSAAVNALAISSVTTTYVSGTLTSAVTNLVRRIRSETEPDAPAAQSHVWLPLVVWFVYLGTAVGIAGALQVGLWLALGVPLLLLLLVIAIALVRFRSTVNS